MHAPPINGQPECDHTPEKRSVTIFFHQRPPSRLHVTTFPQSADTDGTPGAEVRSRRRNVAQSVLPSVRLVRNRLRRVRGLLGSQGRGRWERLRFEVDAPPRSVRLPIAESLKEPSIVRRSIEGGKPRRGGAALRRSWGSGADGRLLDAEGCDEPVRVFCGDRWRWLCHSALNGLGGEDLAKFRQVGNSVGDKDAIVLCDDSERRAWRRPVERAAPPLS